MEIARITLTDLPQADGCFHAALENGGELVVPADIMNGESSHLHIERLETVALTDWEKTRGHAPKYLVLFLAMDPVNNLIHHVAMAGTDIRPADGVSVTCKENA